MVLSLPGARVQTLGGELRSCRPRAVQWEKRKKNMKGPIKTVIFEADRSTVHVPLLLMLHLWQTSPINHRIPSCWDLKSFFKKKKIFY